jgi:phosphoserine phosphatase
MKFNIEIVRDDGKIMFRATVDEVIPARIKKRAAEMLRYHKKRGATVALVSNESGEELYKL